MHTFQELLEQFERHFGGCTFPDHPATLYGPAQYILDLGGKRIRPVLCLMGMELFGELDEDAFEVAVAVELFHNFTLLHDDIMDKAPLRRGKPTVHTRYNEPAALLAGDTMLIYAYEHINSIRSPQLQRILSVFNKTAIEVCEGQQLDMDYEQLHPQEVEMEQYLTMIRLKTSVLLAASLQMGSILGGGSEGNLHHLYEFGKNLGIAFQIQDDLLDAYGDPEKFGKQPGGDILANKKTFLLVKAFALADAAQREQLSALLQRRDGDKVAAVLRLFSACRVDEWARQEKEKYACEARRHLEEIAVLSSRKKPLEALTDRLLNRES
ncbi:polyprenyl synthetase family protein [Compostibacter hankyongensis]|uniref:Polyprenyl synthetase family protein n=1 Tax=Compostibacter hankyongensis TaxID=1007089 RepID=A0ABP8FN41_9BACT